MRRDNQKTDAAPPAISSRPTDALLKYTLDNPLKVLSTLVLSTGGFLLLIYFGRIHFMPDLSLESATSLLYAMALLGLFITAYVSLTMILPGLILYWSKDIFKQAGMREQHVVVMSALLIWLFTCLQIFEVWTGATNWIAISVVAIGSGWFCQRTPQKKTRSTEGTEDATKASAQSQKFAPQDAANWHRIKLWSWGSFVTVFFTFLTSLPVLFFFFFGISGDIKAATSSELIWPLLILLATVLISAYLVEDCAQKGDVKSIVLLAPGLFVLLLVLVGNLSGVGMLPVKLLGQGEVDTARVVVTSAGCREINLALGETVCDIEKDDLPTAICPVVLRSRIGSQVVLEFASVYATEKDVVSWAATTKNKDTDKGRNSLRRVVLDKTRLLSWQPLASLADIPLISSNVNGRMPIASWTTASLKKGLDAFGKINPKVNAHLEQLCGLPSSRSAAPAPAAAVL